LALTTFVALSLLILVFVLFSWLSYFPSSTIFPSISLIGSSFSSNKFSLYFLVQSNWVG
jgi:hypothetical protein